MKNLVGLQAVSQVWATPPAWYVWISGAHGVYQFQLAHSEQRDDRGHHLNGIFTLKCFPFPHGAVFETFSPEERALRTSDLFDETHTPRFEHLERLPEDAFNVAMIECEMRSDRGSARFTLESLSTLKTIDDDVRDAAGPQVQRRCVPGWRLGWFFFNWLLAVYAYESKTVPTRIRLHRSPGFETIRTSSRSVAYRDSVDIHCYTACVDFGKTNGIPEMDNSLQQDGDVLLDCTCPHPGKPHHPLLEQLSDIFPVNDLWWSLALADYPSHLSSTCGCAGHHDDAHHCHLPACAPGQKPLST